MCQGHQGCQSCAQNLYHPPNFLALHLPPANPKKLKCKLSRRWDDDWKSEMSSAISLLLTGTKHRCRNHLWNLAGKGSSTENFPKYHLIRFSIVATSPTNPKNTNLTAFNTNSGQSSDPIRTFQHKMWTQEMLHWGNQTKPKFDAHPECRRQPNRQSKLFQEHINCPTPDCIEAPNSE